MGICHVIKRRTLTLGIIYGNRNISYLVLSYKYSRGAQSRHTIVEAKQRWSVIRWLTKNLLSRAPSCFERHVKPLLPAAFVVVSTHQSTLGPRSGLWPILLMCPSSGDIKSQ
jgi:hypothetical protein